VHPRPHVARITQDRQTPLPLQFLFVERARQELERRFTRAYGPPSPHIRPCAASLVMLTINTLFGQQRNHQLDQSHGLPTWTGKIQPETLYVEPMEEPILRALEGVCFTTRFNAAERAQRPPVLALTECFRNITPTGDDPVWAPAEIASSTRANRTGLPGAPARSYRATQNPRDGPRREPLALRMSRVPSASPRPGENRITFVPTHLWYVPPFSIPTFTLFLPEVSTFLSL